MPRRHRATGKRLSRSHNQRKALLKGLLTSLITHGSVKTTATKAKAVQSLFDKLVSRARPATVHARRLILSFLGDKKAAGKLVDDISKRSDRKSGFTRITKLGLRKGDNAQIVKLEIIDPAPEKPKKTAKPADKDKKKDTKKSK